MRYLWKILKSKKTVFNYDDIKNILWIENKNTIKKFFERAVKEGIFINIYKWLYAFEDFDLFELAIKIKKNSYISFETVLKKEQIIFQDYWNTVFLASDNSLKKKKNNVNFEYLKIKNSILLNPLWLIRKIHNSFKRKSYLWQNLSDKKLLFWWFTTSELWKTWRNLKNI